MWLYRSAKPDKPVVLFDYRETRQAAWPKDVHPGITINTNWELSQRTQPRSLFLIAI